MTSTQVLETIKTMTYKGRDWIFFPSQAIQTRSVFCALYRITFLTAAYALDTIMHTLKVLFNNIV